MTSTDAPKAVIFDMDGVLIDSYQAHYESWVLAGKDEGVEVTEAGFLPTFGRTSREAVPMLWPEHSHTPERIKEVDDLKEAHFRDIVCATWPEMPGARELLTALHQAGFRLAVASSGPPENVNMTTEHFEEVVLPGEQVFGAVITAADVTKGKPEPEVFLKAAERLGVAPANCVVVEDAAPGIKAAAAAGMACFVVQSTGHDAKEYDSLPVAKLVQELKSISKDDFEQALAT